MAFKKDKPNTKGRVSITTMINPELRDKMKLMSLDTGIKFTDLLHQAILEYLKNNK